MFFTNLGCGKMVNLDFINNTTKIIVGIIAILLCIIVYFITPDYIEFYLIFIFLIPAIALIAPNDVIKNSKIEMLNYRKILYNCIMKITV